MRIVCPVQLTEREAAFVVALTYEGMAPTTAAVASGHAMSTARLLLQRPHIQAALSYVRDNAQACIGNWERREAKRAAKRGGA